MKFAYVLLFLFSTSLLGQQATPATAAAPIVAQAPATSPPPQQIEGMQRKLADWPALAHYRDENIKLGDPAPGEKRVVFMGDSITEFWGKTYGKFFPGKPYVNRGISGQTTPQMLVRFQQDVLHLKPTVVVLAGGINDIAGNTGPESLEDIEDNYRSMVQLAKAAHIRVVITSPLPASSIPWRPSLHPAETVRQLNLWIKEYAQTEHLVYVNYYSAMVDDHGGIRPDLAIDKAVHPNDAGYAIMEPLAQQAIERALAEPQP
ncbi:SGNH/GDSL hydrolase family protein [Granulicella mallensis]|uniref:Lipolytic protein G-D-S-L family n=1 Tax=Granulicella mallensis (strain ATCC BAA-1857 / DSM 23137 / MP5ACTX8) TaxID=682795 RepID=G8P069_GRAMM|nr:SGNH/GDSL hydrolase family protein [Granulicella mallensis]AEU36863.1 lipolytic protein G-D-S-L family [Granulicella mallensis MP5ACTX8]